MTAAKKIDPTTQQFFENQLKAGSYAGASDILRMERAKPITAYRKEFLRGARGKVDGKRAAVFMEAVSLRNNEAHVLEYFLAISLCGFRGTIVPHDLNASMCSEIVSCKCGERSFRGAVSSLEKKGWLSKVLIPTGQIVATALDASGREAAHKLLKVCKITLTPAAKLLVSRGVCDKPLPRQNLPVAPLSNKQNQKGTLGRSLSGSCEYENLKIQVTSRAKQANDTQPVASEVEKTSAPVPVPVPEHVGQSHVGESSVPARKPAKKRGPILGRKTRNKARKTWSANRASFLADLFRIAKDDNLHRVAALQTDLQYPPLLPQTMDWNSIIFSWHEHDRAQANRIMAREIVPELKAFCANLFPPNPAELAPAASLEARAAAEKQLEAFKRLRRIFTGFSDTLVAPNMPEYVLEEIGKRSWTLDQIPWKLMTGKFGLAQCTESDFEAFRDVADLLGGDD